MSGIFGIVDSRHRSNIHALTNKMSAAMSHRHWFVAESFVDEAAGVSLGRIGIGIFNKAQQPIWNPTHTIALVMAGEFYKRDTFSGNNPSLSDEEFALALYEKQGDGFAKQLNGAFLIGIYNKTENRVLIVNDRFGLYPLYYACLDGKLLFAPEVKGLLCDNEFTRRLDITALAQYVRFQHLLGTRTFFEDIHLLPAGSVLQFDIATSSCVIDTYWSYTDIPYRPEMRFNEAVEETGYLFRQAVARLSSGPYRPGVYLSGGLDARSILGMIERRPIVSVNYGARNCRDVYYANRIAKAVGSDHHWFDFPNGKWVEQIADFHLELTEGFHSWIHAHGMSTLPRARELMDVNLTGWDGGSVMAYAESPVFFHYSTVDDNALTVDLFTKFNQQCTWPSITESEEGMLYCEPTWKRMKGRAFESFRIEFSKYLHYRQDMRGQYFFLDNHCSRLTQNFIIFTRSHVEVRFPFFDYDLIDFVFSLPAQMLAYRKFYRAIIQREMPRLAYIPYDKDEVVPTTNALIRGVQAESVRFKRRVNRHIAKIFPERHPLYADYDEYLRTDLREWAERILYDKKTEERGIFDSSFLRSLMNRHLSGLEIWTIGKIAPLITYEMMLRRYFD